MCNHLPFRSGSKFVGNFFGGDNVFCFQRAVEIGDRRIHIGINIESGDAEGNGNQKQLGNKGKAKDKKVGLMSGHHLFALIESALPVRFRTIHHNETHHRVRKGFDDPRHV